MRRILGFVAWPGALLLLTVLLTCERGGPAPALHLPPRPADAPDGPEIARDLRGLELEAREARILTEVARGNLPGWLRALRRVELGGHIGGREHRVTFWATPDYLVLGSDTGFLHVPLTPRTAQRVADLVGASLPTPPMVDAIWEAADARLAPIRLTANERMTTVPYFVRHNSLVKGQRQLYGVAPGDLVAGHKKDVVLSARLADHPGKVAIYGSHGSDGAPNQPLSTVLREGFVPYNHGIRLVHRRILVDGEERDLRDVLRDPALAPLLSAGGAIPEPWYPVEVGSPQRAPRPDTTEAFRERLD